MSESDGTWVGFEIQSDAYPDWAGVELLRRLRELGLAEVCRRIREARLFSKMTLRARLETHADRGDLSWMYLIDPVAQDLRVFNEGALTSAHAPKLLGAWAEVAVHQIQADGSCKPPTMDIQLPAPWPHLRVDETWASVEGHSTDLAKEDDRAATMRLDVRRRVARDCAALGMSVETFVQSMIQAITETIVQQGFKGVVPAGRVYFCMPWTSQSKYWRVSFGGLDVCYPPAGWGRSGAVKVDGSGREIHELFCSPDLHAPIDMQRSALIGSPEPRNTLIQILISAFPNQGWVFALLDLVRATQVADPRGEELERLEQTPQVASDWQEFVHPDGRVWAVRASAKGYQLRLGDPLDPVFKERVAPRAELAAVIAEQVADGFIRRN